MRQRGKSIFGRGVRGMLQAIMVWPYYTDMFGRSTLARSSFHDTLNVYSQRFGGDC